MAKKKFAQEIADILADDLALLEAIEPGAIVRPVARPREAAQPEPPGQEQPTPEQPHPEASTAQPVADETPPAVPTTFAEGPPPAPEAVSEAPAAEEPSHVGEPSLAAAEVP